MFNFFILLRKFIDKFITRKIIIMPFISVIVSPNVNFNKPILSRLFNAISVSAIVNGELFITTSDKSSFPNNYLLLLYT